MIISRLKSIDPKLDLVARDLGEHRLARAGALLAFVGLTALLLSIQGALLSAAILVLAEIMIALAVRPLSAGKNAALARRWFTLAAIVLSSSALAVNIAQYWLAGAEYQRFVAIMAACGTLFAGQLLTSRSKLALFLHTTPPTIGLVVPMVLASDLHGLGAFATPIWFLCIYGSVISGGLIAKKNAEALEGARAAAVTADQAKSAFLAMMSHELRTPMNGVLGMAHALRLSRLTRTQSEYVNLLIQSGEGLMTILSDILDISKIEAGRLAFEATPTDLHELCRLTVSLWSDVASGKDVRLSYRIAPDTPQWIMCDPTRLRQVITNLLSNALKFTEHGEVTLTVRTADAPSPGRTALEIAVSDTGIGMTEEQMARLFEPFSQAELSTTRRFGGTGLGLHICRRLVQMMDGEISVESQLGQGATFCARIELPLAEAAAAAVQADVASAEGLRLLVVEDNAISRSVASAVLGAVGAVVETANDGVEALERLTRAHFDVVLMDIHMPRMDGVQALTRIRAGEAGRADIPVIALSADAIGAEAKRLRQLGFDTVQPKPIEPVSLVAAIVATAASGRRSPEKTPERRRAGRRAVGSSSRT